METATAEKVLEDRVTARTSPQVNAKIMRGVEKSLVYYADRPDEIGNRLAELRREWDIERMLEANASVLALFGLMSGLLRRRSWLIFLPFIVLGFLLQHAIKGWCPPITVLRRLGVRTKEEIVLEHYGLRALRGEFEPICSAREQPMPDRANSILSTLNG